MGDEWFSVALRRVCFIAEEGASTSERCVHLIRASDREDAFLRALALGHDSHHEEEYLNGEGKVVRWRFDCVLTLDELGDADLDGREVDSTFQGVDPPLGQGVALDPDATAPGVSGVM